MLLSLLRLYLQSHPPPRAIVKAALSAATASPRGAQGGLFQPARPQSEKLELTIARLTHLVGEGHVGAPELVDTHRPGKFRMSGFSIAAEKHEKRGKPSRAGQEDGSGRNIAPQTAFRFFRPPLPARVEIREGRPARLSFQGQSVGIAAASGPWRTSGEWWDAETWQCDEWDVEVCFSSRPAAAQVAAQNYDQGHAAVPQSAVPATGVYRIFFDGIRREWFVRGAYD